MSMAGGELGACGQESGLSQAFSAHGYCRAGPQDLDLEVKYSGQRLSDWAGNPKRSKPIRTLSNEVEKEVIRYASSHD
jgi:hypothetical protein